jgi:uncharacterized protein (DUF1684 family)
MATDSTDYTAELDAWRMDAEAALRAPDGWLSVAGLFWLKEGVNEVGGDPACAVALPAGSAPPVVARLLLRDGAVTVQEAGPEFLVNGEAPPERPLRPSVSARPDRISVGRLALQLHQAGGRLGVRVRDPENPARTSFPGRRWYAPRPEYRVKGNFVAYEPPRPVTITNMLGDTEQDTCPGYVAFTLDGQPFQLDVSGKPGVNLKLVFRDATSGHETYGAARFLYFDIGPDGAVVLDFNRAVSPPCAFTEFATCPLPPPQNRLKIAIPAGELAPEEH